MQIATGHNLSVTYVTEELFRDVSFAVDSGAHIGLVGKNGSGKTTLFRLITGQLTPTTGQVIFSRECRLAYMEQFLDITPGSLSVLGLMNDKEKRVQLLIDKDVLGGEYIGVHPCVNTASLKIKTSDLVDKIIPAMGHEPIYVELPWLE